MDRPSVIVTEGLSKHYGAVVALDGLSLEVRRGEVFGLLGPNGSGKTTAIRLLLGMLRATAGWAKVDGLDVWRESLEVRRTVSYLPGEIRMYGSLTGLGVLRLLSGLRGGMGLDRAIAIAERVMDLDLRRRVRTYSTGMKQKLALALAFGDPVDTLILDEPTSALDPSARGIVLDLVRQARSEGQTVIFSGHVLSEVEQVADRVAIMRKGQLMHVENLATGVRLRMVLLRFASNETVSIPPELGLVPREANGPGLLFEHHGSLQGLLSWLASAPVADVAIGVEDLQSLYDRFHGPRAEGEGGIER